MKKLLLILLFPVFCYAQDSTKKTVTPPVKIDSVEYVKYVKVSVNDLTIFVDALNKWKHLEMTNPKSTAEQKVQTYQAIEKFLAEFQQRARIDSALVIPSRPKK